MARPRRAGRMWALNLMKYRERAEYADGRESTLSGMEHKDAGMEFTIVMATFPVDGDPVPPQVSGADPDRLMLLQVVADADSPDIVANLEATRIGRFEVEDRIIGDHRTFAEARFDLISRGTAAELAARGHTHDEANYVPIADPTLDDVARSLTDPTRVLP